MPPPDTDTPQDGSELNAEPESVDFVTASIGPRRRGPVPPLHMPWDGPVDHPSSSRSNSHSMIPDLSLERLDHERRLEIIGEQQRNTGYYFGVTERRNPFANMGSTNTGSRSPIALSPRQQRSEGPSPDAVSALPSPEGSRSTGSDVGPSHARQAVPASNPPSTFSSTESESDDEDCIYIEVIYVFRDMPGERMFRKMQMLSMLRSAATHYEEFFPEASFQEVYDSILVYVTANVLEYFLPEARAGTVSIGLDSLLVCWDDASWDYEVWTAESHEGIFRRLLEEWPEDEPPPQVVAEMVILFRSREETQSTGNEGGATEEVAADNQSSEARP